MMMIGFLLLAVLTMLLLVVYIYFWLKRLETFLGYPPKSPWSKLPLAVIAVLLCGASFNLFSTTGIVLLHFWLLACCFDLTVWLVNKLPAADEWKERQSVRAVCALSLIPMAVTAIWMFRGADNMTHVQRSAYTVSTEKLEPGQRVRVLLLTDLHYGTIQNPSVLADALPALQAENPDLIVLGGDIVEEGTSAEDMEEAFRLLGSLQSTYGTFFVYGNHDRQLYSSHPTYTQEALRDAIEGNGITVLQDSAVTLGEKLVLYGREDASRPGMSADGLLAGAEDEKLILLADHQPTRAAENAAAGADIQLSGHTHAGQIWPIGNLIELFGSLNYGHYPVEGSHVYVSSGFAGWGFTVRTSVHCEYVVLDIFGIEPSK